jgi:hypothetical protein
VWVLERAQAELWPEGTIERRRRALEKLGISKVYPYFTDGRLASIELNSLHEPIDWTAALPLDSALNGALARLQAEQEKRAHGTN